MYSIRFAVATGLATLAALVLAAHPASAQTFTFSYSGASVTASGTLTTTPDGNPGEFLVTGISGARNASTITGLIGPNGYASNDNLIFTNGSSYTLDGGGISYDIGTTQVNFSSYTGGYEENNPPDTLGYPSVDGSRPVSVTINRLAAVPEPSRVIPFALGGLGLLGLTLRARRRRAA